MSKKTTLPVKPSDANTGEILASSKTDSCSIDLGYLKLIKVSGSDAENFLQAQLSNDIGNLPSNSAQLHGYCNPKGRTIAILRVMRRHEGGFWILLPASIAEPVIKRLQMFVLRAQVKFELEIDGTAVGVLGHLPADTGNEVYYDVAGIMPRAVAIVIDRQKVIDRFDRALHGDFWKLLDIESGIPQVYDKTSEAFIPQHISLDLVDGVSFKKGCYPGQEIVARLRYLGKTRQRLAIAHVESEHLLYPGTAVFSSNKPDQKAGQIVDCVQTGAKTWILSAVIPLAHQESASLHVDSISGPTLALQPLPYELPED